MDYILLLLMIMIMDYIYYDINGKHPKFPWPSFWHFKKTRETRRRFAGELLIHEPLLINLHKIGLDLDKGLA